MKTTNQMPSRTLKVVSSVVVVLLHGALAFGCTRGVAGARCFPNLTCYPDLRCSAGRCESVVAHSAAAAAPGAPDGVASWKGRWVIEWSRPTWWPRIFNGKLLMVESSGKWSTTLIFSETAGSFLQKDADVRTDAAHLVYTVGSAVFELELSRDGDDLRGKAQWLDDAGKVVIAWSPVTGRRATSPAGPLVLDGIVTPWSVATPAEVGLDEAAVREIVNDAREASCNGLVLVRDSRLVAAVGSDVALRSNITSVSKALSSLAVPFLLAEGKWPSLDAPIGPALGWGDDDPRSAISLRHVLSHSTGLETPEYRSWVSSARDDFRTDLRSAKLIDVPGSKFFYSNRTSELTSEVVAYAAGIPLDEYLKTRLLEPLGVGAEWWRDTKGHTVVHAGVRANAIDLATIGAMLADDGMWKGKRVLPAGWVATATGASATTAPERRPGLGWFLLPADEGFEHTGDSGSFLLVSPRKRMAAAAVICSGSAVYPLMRGVWHLKPRSID